MQILTALLGVFLIAYSTIQVTHPIAVWSDFKAFQARVAQNDHGSDILKYGGESEHESFEDLLTKVWDLQEDWRMIIYVGFLLIFIPVIQVASNRRKRNREPTS